MKNVKHELQHIIDRDEPIGQAFNLKKVQNFLRRYAETSIKLEKQQHFKSEEEIALIQFAKQEGLLVDFTFKQSSYISAGAEQTVYRFDDFNVVKLNESIFYEYWLDYFNSLLLHNYFFPPTQYDFLGFTVQQEKLFAIVKQQFIVATEPTNLQNVQQFLEFNSFKQKRNYDYYCQELGVILEDLHDENVLTSDGILFFIDTVFYLTPQFYVE